MNYNNLKTNPSNPRNIKKEQFERLKKSIGSFTKMLEIRPIAYDEDGVIWGGNMRYEALKSLDIEMKPEYFKELKGFSLKEKREFAIRDNIELGKWDDDILANEWSDLPLEEWGINIKGWEDKEELNNESVKGIKDIKILNLYAGIGGNRKLWGDLKVTSVEYSEEIAAIYKDYFPNDELIIGDAHDYLEKHFEEYDFIWSSPPCPTHSKLRKGLSMATGAKPKYPDMKLYEEILFLQGYFKGRWIVENVKSWYDPLIEPQERGRHYYWSNFDIPESSIFEKKENVIVQVAPKVKKKWGFDLTKYKVSSKYPKNKILNNMVHPEIGKFILESAYD